MINLMPPPETGSSLANIGIVPMLAQATTSTQAPQPARTAEFFDSFMEFLPTLVGAILFLVVGLILATFVAWAVKRLLTKTNLDERIAATLIGTSTSHLNVAKWVSRGVFWIIAILAVIGFLNTLNLTVVSGPLSNLIDTVLQYVPRIFSAAILLAIAWAIATIVRTLVNRTLEGFNLDDRLAENTGVDPRENSLQIHETLGNALYWFIFLLFLPPILNALELNGLLAPVQGLLDQFLGAIPQILTALLVFGAGWLLAKIARGIVTNLLSASGVDSLGRRVGLSSSSATGRGLSLSGLAGTIVYIFILIPFSIAALNELDIQAISEPAVNMLNQILQFIPLLLAAGVVLAVFYFIGKFVSELVSSLLASAGFDNILDILGLPDISPATYDSAVAYDPTRETTPQSGATMIQPPSRSKSPSEVVGLIALVGVVLFGLVTATEILQLEQLTTIVSAVMGIAAKVLVGAVIFAIGLYIANLAYRLIKASGSSGMLAQTARVVILAFVGALALGQMGVAPNIVNLAFGLLLGAVSVAIAIAFGLGGRDVAGKQLQEWLSEIKR
jgi:Conserved TM helix